MKNTKFLKYIIITLTSFVLASEEKEEYKSLAQVCTATVSGITVTIFHEFNEEKPLSKKDTLFTIPEDEQVTCFDEILTQPKKLAGVITLENADQAKK